MFSYCSIFCNTSQHFEVMLVCQIQLQKVGQALVFRVMSYKFCCIGYNQKQLVRFMLLLATLNLYIVHVILILQGLIYMLGTVLLQHISIFNSLVLVLIDFISWVFRFCRRQFQGFQVIVLFSLIFCNYISFTLCRFRRVLRHVLALIIDNFY